MGSVTVTPQEFAFVLFDAGELAATMTQLLDRLGFGDRDVLVEVDETSPIARVQVRAGDPLVLWAESGAFEDSRRPRALSPEAVVTSAGRMLLRQRDRESGGFDDAPPDDALTLAQTAAWDTYAIARLGRLGYATNRQRWLYNFRNRHGFTDDGDRSFDELWTADGLTWAQLSSLSERALAARQPA